MPTKAYAVWSAILFRISDQRYIEARLYGYANLTEAEASGQILAELTERNMAKTHIIQRGTVRREGVAEMSPR